MNTVDQPTVFIVDDDAAVRDSILELVQSVELRGESYDSAQAFLAALDPSRPGCLVLDVRMGGMSGIVLQEKLNELAAAIPVIILTGHGDVPMAVRALKNGALDFIEKPYREQQLLDSINKALALAVQARQVTEEKAGIAHLLANLTPRELEILKSLLKGGTSKLIARKLDISPRTVEVHRHNLLQKLNVKSLKELMLHQNILQFLDPT